MRRPSQYFLGAIVGGLLGALVAESDILLGTILGIGVGMLFVLFCHVYPHVGYAERKLGNERKFNS